MPEISTPPTRPQGALPPIDLRALADTAVAVIRNPTDFYRGIKAETGFQKCLVFSIAMGVIYGVLCFVGTLLAFSISAGVGPAVLAALRTLIAGVFSGLIAPFVGGFLIAVISVVFGSKGPWEPSVRIAAYSMAVAPVAGAGILVSFVPLIGGVVAIVVGLAAWCYGIYICYLGAKVINFEAPPAATTPPV